MIITSAPQGRAPWYDRTASMLFDSETFASSVQTDVVTTQYIVPEGLILRLDLVSAVVRVVNPPTTAGSFTATLILVTPVLGSGYIKFGVAQIATVADSVAFSIQSPLWLYEGDRFQIQYSGVGVGGTLDKYLSYAGTLFTA